MTPFSGKNRLTSAYGWRTLRGARQWHAGQDIVGDDDAQVRAIWNSYKCEVAHGWNGGRGNLVILYYSSVLRVVCQHMASISVKNGQAVNQGQAVGQMGNTGDSLGAHLHIEVQRFTAGRWAAVPPAGYTEVPNTVASHPGNSRPDGGAQDKDCALVRLKIGPASTGDREQLGALCARLGLPVKETAAGPGRWSLLAGPASVGDAKTLKDKAGRLGLPCQPVRV